MEPGQKQSDLKPSEESAGERPSGRRAASGADADTLAPGLVLAGKYRIDEILGKGGMGVVYAATQLTTGKRVAIKFRLARCPENRFSSEAIAAARIRHPNVIDIYDIGNEEGASYLVMELLDGETLAAVLKRGRLSPRDALYILLSAAEGVAAAHAKGIVHRDLKPDNIFVTGEVGERPRIKVLDFGIAKFQQNDAAPHDALTQSGDLLGTPSYMSPEQLQTPERVDARSDVYSLGVILYEALTGQRPFPSANYHVLIIQISTARALPPTRLNPDIPASVSALVERAMAPEPRARFQSVEELIRGLRHELRSEASTQSELDSHHDASSRSSVRRAQQRKALFLLALVTCALAAVVTYVARTGSPARVESPIGKASMVSSPKLAPSLATPPPAEIDAAAVQSREVRQTGEPVEKTPPLDKDRAVRRVRARMQAAQEVRNVDSAPQRANVPSDDWAGPLLESELR